MASPADQIARINLLSATARTSWLALLAFLAYIGITLLAVQDVDFFVPSRETLLPLVGISIPTFSFFIFAPPLAAALYVYLHIHLLKLWDALAEAPYVVDGAPLGESLHPWIANDFALGLKGYGALRPRPLRRIGAIATFALVWAAAPLIIFGFWLRSSPAHEPLLTLWIALSFLIAAYAGAASLRAARLRFHFGPAYPTDRRWPRWQTSLACISGVLLLAVSWFRTGTGLDTYVARAIDAYEAAFDTCLFADTQTHCDPTSVDWTAQNREAAQRTFWGSELNRFGLPSMVPRPLRLTSANLVDQEFVDLPPDWRPPKTARLAYRETWCRREGLALSVCGHLADRGAPPVIPLVASRNAWCATHDLTTEGACIAHFSDLDIRFRGAWVEERRATRENLPGRHHPNIDLRRADASGVSLVGANLVGAKMEGANLFRAQMEGAYLVGAQMEGASLFYAELEGSDLTDALMEGADLSGASLRMAVLAGAQMRSPAFFADFRGAQGLTQTQLDNIIGHDETLLPDGPNEHGEPFHVWTCWETPPRDFDVIVRAAAGPFQREDEIAALGRDLLCSPENRRRKTGTPLPLDAPYPPGHPLGGND